MGPVIVSYTLIIIVGLIISLALSNKFADFAEQKGYERNHYFWICFFLGMLGYVWVAALPDAALRREIAALKRQNLSLTQKPSPAAAPKEAKPDVQTAHMLESTSSDRDKKTFSDGQWLCPNCYILNSADTATCKKCGAAKE